MTRDLFVFPWVVAPGGYEIKQARPTMNPSRRISPHLIYPHAPIERKEYTPLRDETGLFLEFANTPPTAEGILAFSNQFGPLGGSAVNGVVVSNGSRVDMGEAISIWTDQIDNMRRVVNVWNEVKAGRGKLDEFIQWRKHGVFYIDSRSQIVIASNNKKNERLEFYKKNDLYAPARDFLQDEVNKGLQGRISPRLLWDSIHRSLRIHFVPDSLLGCLWLQCAQAIEGKKEYRKCDVCEKPFEVKASERGQERTHCSNACKQRAYRKRARVKSTSKRRAKR